MRSVSHCARPLIDACRRALVDASVAALLPVALAAALAAALLVAAPAARAQSTSDTSTATETEAGTAAFRGRFAAGAGPIDDQTLSHQRGRAVGVGMMMVAATPDLRRGNGVTLWDEIAPPAPLPVPVDASQAAQGNIASYTRR